MQSLFQTKKDTHTPRRSPYRTSKHDTVCIVRLVAIYMNCLNIQPPFFYVVIFSISREPLESSVLLEKGKFAQAFALSLETLSITKRWNDSLSYFIHGESCANNCLLCGVILHNVDFSSSGLQFTASLKYLERHRNQDVSENARKCVCDIIKFIIHL